MAHNLFPLSAALICSFVNLGLEWTLNYSPTVFYSSEETWLGQWALSPPQLSSKLPESFLSASSVSHWRSFLLFKFFHTQREKNKQPMNSQSKWLTAAKEHYSVRSGLPPSQPFQENVTFIYLSMHSYKINFRHFWNSYFTSKFFGNLLETVSWLSEIQTLPVLRWFTLRYFNFTMCKCFSPSVHLLNELHEITLICVNYFPLL